MFYFYYGTWWNNLSHPLKNLRKPCLCFFLRMYLVIRRSYKRALTTLMTKTMSHLEQLLLQISVEQALDGIEDINTHCFCSQGVPNTRISQVKEPCLVLAHSRFRPLAEKKINAGDTKNNLRQISKLALRSYNS